MNLTAFIKQTDKISQNMTLERMQAFMHDYTRSVPESRREAFLEQLLAFAGGTAGAGAEDVKKQDRFYEEKLKEDIAKNREQLEQIESGDIFLEEILNEQYDEWYNSGEDEFYYEDPENIGETIQESCALVHACVDSEMYGEGFALAEFLFLMHVQTDGEYGCGEFSLRDLARENIITIDYEAFVLEALLSAYWGNELEKRPEAVYCILQHASCPEISLEMLMSKSRDELAQFSEFLKLWTDYLGGRAEPEAEKLLQEAVLLADDQEALLYAARKFAGLHPGLYIKILEQYQKEGQAEAGLEIGREALEQIPAAYQVRSRAALLTAQAALKLGRQEAAEECWLEAFRSDTRPVSYLRLMLECLDAEKYQKAAEQIYRELFSKKEEINKRMACAGERRENAPQRSDYYALLFFDGKIQQMIAWGMQEKHALGWSSTFMKEGMALLFLVLYQGEELREGCRAMCRMFVQAAEFRAGEYLEGTSRSTNLSDEQFFWECLLRRRQSFLISQKEAEDMMKMLEHRIKTRTEAIMDKSRRNYYGECAAFIAAFGEVKESRGVPHAKEDIMETYRSMYSRRRAFHQELRSYGMRR